MSEPYVAEIRIFAGNFAPASWAFCNGQLLPISQNSALFSLIGTTYGGDGENTTALPNLQGRAPMNFGTGPGLTTRRIGERGGTEQVTLTQSQMPAHTHPLRVSSDETEFDGTPNPGGNVPGELEGGKEFYAPGNNLVDLHPDAIEPVGGGLPHNNMQPYLALNFIIALTGVFPSRS